MKIGLWSTTAANNNSTPPDGFPEGMAPSTLNDAAREVMAAVRTYAQDAEWFDHGMSPTYIGANTFSVPGDQTALLRPNRMLRLYDATTVVRPIDTVSYAAATTVVLGAGTALTASLSSFAVSALNPDYSSLPTRISAAALEVTGTVSTPAVVAVQGAKAWVSARVSVGAMTIRSSYNVASISRSATHSYRITFTNALADDQYLTVVSVNDTLQYDWAPRTSAGAAALELRVTPFPGGIPGDGKSDDGNILNVVVYR